MTPFSSTPENDGSWGEQLLPTFEDFAQANQLSLPAIEAARGRADRQVEKIRDLVENELDLPDTLALVVFGSLARRETTSGSDVDWTLLVDGPVDPEHFQLVNQIAQCIEGAGFTAPGSSATFGTLASSHDLVHHIGGLEDSNRKLTRRLLLLLESQSVAGNGHLVRERVLRAILSRYIVCGRGVRIEQHPQSKVPRFLFNDVVRFWRTIAVDYAAKKWEQGDGKWALRNAKLRVSRKMTFVKGILLCFYCELFPDAVAASMPPDAANDDEGANIRDAGLIKLCVNLVETPAIDLLCHVLHRLGEAERAQTILESYDRFLALLEDSQKREALSKLEFDAAADDPVFCEVREQIGQSFGSALEDLFFSGPPELAKLTKKYGLF